MAKFVVRLTDEAATDEKDGAVDAREETLSAVVDVLSSSAKKDRDERTKEENEKLDQVLKDLNDLTKMSKEERDSAEVKAKFESLFEILDVDVSPTMSKEDVKCLKDEVFGYNTFYVTGNMHPHPAGVHFFQQDFQLQFGQTVAHAAVNAVTKRYMLPRVFAVNDELIGIFKLAFVPIARGVPHHHAVALLDFPIEHPVVSNDAAERIED